MNKILLIEDDYSFGRGLKEKLEEQNYDILWIKSKQELNEIDISKIELVLLDWNLPDAQGIDLLKNLLSVPVIMLSARVDLIDKVLGLESGAVDYITKPFEFRELLARIRVQFRKDSITFKNIDYGLLKINYVKREIWFKKIKVNCTKMEFDLLYLLASEAEHVFSRDKLLDKVWGFEHFPTTRTVDTHILQLRQKLEPDVIETVRGVGYRFNLEFVKKS